MPRVCTVCRHPARQAIETAIVTRVPNRDIAARHGLTSSGVWRHGQTHLRATLVKATEAAEVAHANGLRGKVAELERRATMLLNAAEKGGRYVSAVQALKEVRECVTLMAKVTGELDERANVNVLVTSPDWLKTRSRILEALRPFPDALTAVAAALREDAAA